MTGYNTHPNCGGMPFVNGINVAWIRYGQDFGGNTTFQTLPLHQDAAAITDWSNMFADIAAHGINVARVWLLPELWTTDIVWNGTQAGGTNGNLAADLCVLLDLAAANNVQVQPVIAGFDWWKKRGNPGCTDPNHSSIATYVSGHDIWQAGHFPDLVNNVIVPLIIAAENCMSSAALHSWDVANEPELVVDTSQGSLQDYVANAGTGILTAGQEFDPRPATCWHNIGVTDMRQILTLLRDAVKNNSTCPVTVGLNTKWSYAFNDLGWDYLSLHTYEWSEPFFPTVTTQASTVTASGMPVLIGEFPNNLSSTSSSQPPYYTVEESTSGWKDMGYLGHMIWSYTTREKGFTEQSLDDLDDFAQENIRTIDTVLPTPAVISCGQGPQQITGIVLNKCMQPVKDASISPGSWTYDDENCLYNGIINPGNCTEETQIDLVAEAAGNDATTVLTATPASSINCTFAEEKPWTVGQSLTRTGETSSNWTATGPDMACSQE